MNIEHVERVREKIRTKDKKKIIIIEKRSSHTNYSLLMGFSKESFGTAAPYNIRQII